MRRGLVLVAALLSAGTTAAAQTPVARPGVPRRMPGPAPLPHPIKGNFTPVNPREYCITRVAKSKV